MPARRNPPFKLTLLAATGRPHAPYLRRMLRRARTLLPQSKVHDFTLLIVGDERMSALHAQFMNDPSPTDVLTFELDHDPKGNPTEGQVVINLHEARRRASEHKARLQDELLLYALHGLLHLSGYDDTTNRAYHLMHAKEDQILTKLGVGPVFGAKSKGRRR
jgi:probable rRNA maturation factor